MTLVELLVVVGTLAVSSLLLLPTLAQARTGTHAFVCQNNLRQLLSCLTLYAADNRDFLPGNFQSDGPGQWVAGDMGSRLDATNTALLTNFNSSGLARYTGAATNLYHCPADSSTVTWGNQSYPRMRSVSMNGAVGTAGGQPALPGFWLDGSFSPTASSSNWRVYPRLADMVAPTPAGLFVFTEEDPSTINDGALAVTMGLPQWVDRPATFHNYGCVFGFADGHAETHQWQDTSTRCPNPPVVAQLTGATNDIGWLQKRVSARIY